MKHLFKFAIGAAVAGALMNMLIKRSKQGMENSVEEADEASAAEFDNDIGLDADMGAVAVGNGADNPSATLQPGQL